MPAAGSGSRFGPGVRKQYAPLEGRTVIEWALAPFLGDRRCAQLVVALARDDADWKKVAARLAASGASAVTTVEGGERRSDSVRRALESLAASASPSDWVLVHDAARPCLDPADLGRLLDRLGTHPVGGLLATRVSDTLKRAARIGGGADPPVAETVERSDLWRALTPQMFRVARRASGTGRGRLDESQDHPGSGSGARRRGVAGAALLRGALEGHA